jgi:hypothetical protein
MIRIGWAAPALYLNATAEERPSVAYCYIANNDESMNG